MELFQSEHTMSTQIDREALANSAVGRQASALDAAMRRVDQGKATAALVAAGLPEAGARQVLAELCGGARLPAPQATGEHLAAIAWAEPETAAALVAGGYPDAHADMQSERIKARRGLARATAGTVVTALAGVGAPPIVLAAAADIAARYARDIPPLRGAAELAANEIACRALCDQLDGQTCRLLRRDCGGCGLTAPWAVRNTRITCPLALWPEPGELRSLPECDANREACRKCSECAVGGGERAETLTCRAAKDGLGAERWRIRHHAITCPLAKWAVQSRAK